MTPYQPPEPPSELPRYEPGGPARPTPHPAPAAPPAPSRLQPLMPPTTAAAPSPAPAPTPENAAAQLFPFEHYQRQAWPVQERAPRVPGRANRVATIVLLSVGLVGAIIGIVTALAAPALTESIYAGRGDGFFESSLSGRELNGMLWGHVALYLISLVVSVLLLRRKRPSFYVPLTAGVIAAVIYWWILIAYATADHTLRYLA